MPGSLVDNSIDQTARLMGYCNSVKLTGNPPV